MTHLDMAITDQFAADATKGLGEPVVLRFNSSTGVAYYYVGGWDGPTIETNGVRGRRARVVLSWVPFSHDERWTFPVIGDVDWSVLRGVLADWRRELADATGGM